MIGNIGSYGDFGSNAADYIMSRNRQIRQSTVTATPTDQSHVYRSTFRARFGTMIPRAANTLPEVGTATDATLWPPVGYNQMGVYVGPLGPAAYPAYEEGEEGEEGEGMSGKMQVALGAGTLLLIAGGAYALLGRGKRGRLR